MKKVFVLLSLLVSLISATPPVSANPVGPRPAVTENAAGYIAMTLALIAFLDLMIHLIRRRKVRGKVIRTHFA